MKKSEQWAKVQEILANAKIKEDSKAYKEFEQLLAPKKSGTTNEFPPKLDEDGNIVEVYCNWHKQYEPVEDFMKSAKNKSGYHQHCKIAMNHWRLYEIDIKALEKDNEEMMNKVLDGDFDLEEAKVKRNENNEAIEKLKEDRSNKLDHPKFGALAKEVEETPEPKKAK